MTNIYICIYIYKSVIKCMRMIIYKIVKIISNNTIFIYIYIYIYIYIISKYKKYPFIRLHIQHHKMK